MKLTRRALALAAGSCLIAGPATAAAFTAAEAKVWQSTYFQHRNAERVADFIVFCRRQGLLSGDTRSYGVRGFLAGVFEQNPNRMADWLNGLDQAPKGEQATLLTAAWFAGGMSATNAFRLLDEARLKEIFGGDPRSRPATRVILIPARSAQDIDLHWGHYFATGSDADLREIVRALGVAPPGGSQSEAGRASALAEAARWSLTSNAKQHTPVFESLKRELRYAGRNRPALEAILRDAESARTNAA